MFRATRLTTDSRQQYRCHIYLQHTMLAVSLHRRIKKQVRVTLGYFAQDDLCVGWLGLRVKACIISNILYVKSYSLDEFLIYYLEASSKNAIACSYLDYTINSFIFLYTYISRIQKICSVYLHLIPQGWNCRHQLAIAQPHNCKHTLTPKETENV